MRYQKNKKCMLVREKTYKKMLKVKHELMKTEKRKK